MERYISLVPCTSGAPWVITGEYSLSFEQSFHLDGTHQNDGPPYIVLCVRKHLHSWHLMAAKMTLSSGPNNMIISYAIEKISVLVVYSIVNFICTDIFIMTFCTKISKNKKTK